MPEPEVISREFLDQIESDAERGLRELRESEEKPNVISIYDFNRSYYKLFNRKELSKLSSEERDAIAEEYYAKINVYKPTIIVDPLDNDKVILKLPRINSRAPALPVSARRDRLTERLIVATRNKKEVLERTGEFGQAIRDIALEEENIKMIANNRKEYSDSIKEYQEKRESQLKGVALDDHQVTNIVPTVIQDGDWQFD